MVDELERLRLQRILSDWITGLPLYPVADLRNERVSNLGVIYLQLGRFAGVESVYGWELYDQVLRCVTESLQADVEASTLRSSFLSIQFTGCDGFYLLFDVAPGGGNPQVRLEKEAVRLRDGAIRRLGQRLGRTIVELMNVHCSAVIVPDDPRVRPSRNVIRGLREAARLVETRETAERLKLIASCRAVLAGRKLHPVYQPVVSIKDNAIVGYEALIRGPAGELELPDVLFAIAHEADMTLELESLCLETIFAKVPRAIAGKKLFVNASPRLLGHAVFLDERNLQSIARAPRTWWSRSRRRKSCTTATPSARPWTACGTRDCRSRSTTRAQATPALSHPQLRPGVHQGGHLDRAQPARGHHQAPGHHRAGHLGRADPGPAHRGRHRAAGRAHSLSPSAWARSRLLGRHQVRCARTVH